MREHPALTETGGLEPPFYYMDLVETFFRAAAEYIIDYDPETEIARFTHIPSSRWVIMARDLRKVYRPDKVLPWGMLRVRISDGHNNFSFITKQISDKDMQSILSDRAGINKFYVDGIAVQSSKIAGAIWYHSPIDRKTAERAREFQYDIVHDLTAQRIRADEISIQKEYETDEGADEPTSHHTDAF